jgi:hypothetical protein
VNQFQIYGNTITNTGTYGVSIWQPPYINPNQLSLFDEPDEDEDDE